jgi:hypothetical protein
VPETANVDYVAALREVGFSDSAAAAGARHAEWEIREGIYLGFGTLVGYVERRGAQPRLRPHHQEPVIRRVEAQEAAARLAERGSQASQRTAASRADEAEHREALSRDVREKSSALVELLKEMTDRELDGRLPMRPHIAEQWNSLFPDSPAR